MIHVFGGNFQDTFGRVHTCRSGMRSEKLALACKLRILEHARSKSQEFPKEEAKGRRRTNEDDRAGIKQALEKCINPFLDMLPTKR